MNQHIQINSNCSTGLARKCKLSFIAARKNEGRIGSDVWCASWNGWSVDIGVAFYWLLQWGESTFMLIPCYKISDNWFSKKYSAVFFQSIQIKHLQPKTETEKKFSISICSWKSVPAPHVPRFASFIGSSVRSQRERHGKGILRNWEVLFWQGYLHNKGYPGVFAVN